MKFFHLIWSNLKRKKLRTILTLLSIVVAFILFGFLSAILRALAGGVTLAGQNRLVVRHKVSIIQSLPESYKARMERIPGVAMATHQSWFGGVYQDPKNFFPQMPSCRRNSSRCSPRTSSRRNRTGLAANPHRGHRRPQNCRAIPLEDRRQGASFTPPSGAGPTAAAFGNSTSSASLTGRTRATDTTPLFFRYDYFEERRACGTKAQVGWYIVRVKDPERAAEVAKLVDQEFENSAAETKTEPEGAFLQGWAKQIGDITLITATILSAVFFTILLVTGNTMSQSVRERTGELGVLKAMGFTNAQVLALVLAESCLLAVLGGGLGLGVAWLMVARGDPTGGMLPLFFFPTKDVLVGVWHRAACSACSPASSPPCSAMRLRVADALRRM